MRSEVVTLETLVQPGLCILLYGPWGSGKTTAVMDLPGKLLIYSTESKDIKRTIHEWYKRNPDQKDKYIKVKYVSDFEDVLGDINRLNMAYESGKRPFDSVGFDTLSFQQMKNKLGFEDSRYEDAIIPDAKGKARREETLIDRYRLEIADWGGVKSTMVRLTGAFAALARHDVYVMCTSAMTEKPKIDRSLDGAPDFEGGFASIAAGFFDLVGAVLPGENEDYPYPPVVTFNHPDYVTRCCSDKLMKKQFGLLNMKKIIEVCEK